MKDITAEEFKKEWCGGFDLDINQIEDLMIEFAKAHVKAALEAAYENSCLSDYSGEKKGKSALGSGCNGDHPIVRIDKDSILTAYPKENIK